jgi:hypothetical protein
MHKADPSKYTCTNSYSDTDNLRNEASFRVYHHEVGNECGKCVETVNDRQIQKVSAISLFVNNPYLTTVSIPFIWDRINPLASPESSK